MRTHATQLMIKLLILLLILTSVLHPSTPAKASDGTPGFFQSLAVPGPFGKSAPASTAMNVTTSPILSWAQSAGADGYEFCIDTIHNDICDTSWNSTALLTSVTPQGVVTGEVYYWQVRAKNGSGDTYADGGNWWQFTTVPTFVDVPYTYWAWDAIERLYRARITAGCKLSPFSYCPDDINTRAQMSLFLERGMRGSLYIPPVGTGNLFLDVPAGYWALNWIEKLYQDGITAGCGLTPLVYCPDHPVTRAQMAVFLLRAKHGASYIPPKASGVFVDVDLNHWAADWIEQLFAEGITGGCYTTPPKYCPERYVTRDQMAVFVVNTFSLP